MTNKKDFQGKQLNATQMKFLKGGWRDRPWDVEDWLNNFGCQTEGTCQSVADCSFTVGCTSPVMLSLACSDGFCSIVQGSPNG